MLPGTVVEEPWVPYCGVVVFSLLTAAAIGYLTRGRRIDSDTAIGIFMVASFAWGIVAQSVYRQHRGVEPVGWATYLFGQIQGLGPTFAVASVLVCAAVVAVVVLLGKEILYYCFDPAMAEAAGVRAGFIHYLLMLLVALTIVIGARIVGTVLVTALLVLPGATALTLARTLRGSVAGAMVIALAGTLAGLAVSGRWGFLPTGPAIVLVLFVLFVLAYAWSRLRRG